jgi:hypothetical protein
VRFHASAPLVYALDYQESEVYAMAGFLKTLGVVFVAALAIFLLIVILVELPWWHLLWGWMLIGIIVIWIATFFDLWRRADISRGTAIIWTAVVIIFPILGTLIYFFTRPSAGEITYRGETVT